MYRTYRPTTQSPSELLDSIAPVNTRLYGQLIAQGRPLDELCTIKRAYDLTCLLYAGAYQGDGRPFIAHVVSVASILSLIGMPSEIVAAGLIHNVYTNGDFGDGRHRATTIARRRRVRDAVGDDIESLVLRFTQLRLAAQFDAVKANIASFDERDRMLLTIELADMLEKHADKSLLYFGNNDWVTRFVDAHEQDLVELGYTLEQPVLADALSRAIGHARSNRIPEALKATPEGRYLYRITPLSCIKRPKLSWSRAIRQSTTWQFARKALGRA